MAGGACSGSLIVALRKTRYVKNKPFQLRHLLQELCFIESGASQSGLRRHEFLALNAAAVWEHHLLPVSRILEQTWGTGCDPRSLNQVHIISAPVFSARTFRSRQLGEKNLAPAERLAGLAASCGARKQHVLTTTCLMQRSEAESDMQDVNDAIVHRLQNSFGSLQ